MYCNRTDGCDCVNEFIAGTKQGLSVIILPRVETFLSENYLRDAGPVRGGLDG